MSEYDVLVLGAGPAGAVAAASALATAPDLSVALVDRATFPRDKCCGDGIAAQAVDVLHDLGMGDVVDGWAPLRHLDLSAGDVAVAGTMSRDVHVIPRAVLDARLVDHAVRRGAELVRHRAVRVDPHAVGGASVDDALLGRTLVGADGAHSRVRSALATGSDLPAPRRALALRGYAPTPPGRRGHQLIRYGPRRQPSYAWAFDRGDGLSNVGYGELVTDGPALSRADLLDQLEQLIPGTVPDGTDWKGHHLPLSGFGWPHPAGRCLLVGDAAGLVNPMTGEGIYYAVATGMLAGRAAAEAVVSGDPEAAGARYRADVRRLLGTHLKHTWAAGGLSHRPQVVAAGIRAAARDQRVFDDLVEIGLGGGRVTPRLGRGLATQLLRRPRRPRLDPRASPARSTALD